MSRIHEALKKAEQERAMTQPTPRAESPSMVLEGAAAAEPVRVMASASVLAGTAPTMGLNYENLLARCPRTRWNPDPNTMLFFSNDEHVPGTEEFRTLRSRLYQIRERQTLSKLLVTSALPKEGKSFTSANLAQVIVRQHGRRALLIDADLRNPTLHKLLGAQPGPGLAEYLRREADEFSVIQQGPLENLFFIPAGLNTLNPAELLANELMKSLLSRLGPLFDWIIIDSPPAVPVSDAALISGDCDGVLLVVRSNGTPVDAARRARGEFAERNLIGVVLNGVNPELSPYMGYYYSAYGSDAKAESKN
jgi:capsular exopolysaccharide synthesis family protein